MEEYAKLINLVNKNLLNNGNKFIEFEMYENLFENIYAFPVEKLLAIKDNEVFLHELYFKLLNRPIEKPRHQQLLALLDKNKTTRIKIIQDTHQSNERIVKKTKLVNTEGIL